ncbi:MAG: AAA family ATPase [Nitrosomonadales bacterium]|nr:AAA family ATPase [Nitrosomonadales bacterium]
MELVILSGIQCSGKSTLYQQKFADTHARVNLDTVKSRSKEMDLYSSIISERRRVVIDNTNPTRQDRAKYIAPAKNMGYQVCGIQLDVPIVRAITRNLARHNQEKIPERIIQSTLRKMQPLSLSEGFDQIVIIRFSLCDRPEVIRVVN